MNCPRCKSQMQETESFLGGPCVSWLECPNCNTFVNTYKPMPHQEALHRATFRTLGNFGGYGTGKTTTSREDIYKHLLITPNGTVLIGAAVQSQYEQTLRRDLERDLPLAFVRDSSAQKQTIDLLNGARIVYRPYDDEGKIRSYNITMGVVLEASEVKEDIYTQLTTRLRGLEATIPETDDKGNVIYDRMPDGSQVPRIKHDWRKLIIESNPDSGWIRNSILLRSSKINQFGTDYAYNQDENKIVKSMASFVAATKVNYRLPSDFEADLRAKNPEWWIKRYLEGSFQFSEGLVYPNAMNNLCKRFPIPRHWKRIIAFDYGIADEAVFLFGAIDDFHGIVYIYKCLHATNRNIQQLAEMYHRGSADIPSGGLYTQPIIDPKSGPKRDYDLVKLADKFLDYGISFRPGAIDVDSRIYMTNTYIEQGRVKIFDDLDFLIDELKEYKFKIRADGQGRQDKPEDVRNHAINAMEWIIMALPKDPRKVVLEVYGKGGERISLAELEPQLPKAWQLADDNPYEEERTNHKWY